MASILTHPLTFRPSCWKTLYFTIGAGNQEIRSLVAGLAKSLVGFEVEELMSQFGIRFKQMADHPQYRWLGPHKGMIHLALASITNACYDLWAKVRGVPLWKLLIDLTPNQIVDTLDLSYLEDELTKEEPTQPDDLIGHQTLAREIAPIDIALGEHVSNRVMFKNFITV